MELRIGTSSLKCFLEELESSAESDGITTWIPKLKKESGHLRRTSI
jgi:hypothetical protein